MIDYSGYGSQDGWLFSMSCEMWAKWEIREGNLKLTPQKKEKEI